MAWAILPVPITAILSKTGGSVEAVEGGCTTAAPPDVDDDVENNKDCCSVASDKQGLVVATADA